MDLYARVNILDGRAVRLPRGDLREAIALDADPVHRARSWVEQGADFIHVVDLDAAAHADYRNRPLIDRLVAALEVPVQVAGGIRSHVEAARLLERGAWRIVMGTAAIEDQNMLWDLCREYPGRVVVSLDVRPDEELAVRGWTENSGRYLEEVLIEMSSAGVAAFLVAEAARDALEEPPNLEVLRRALSIVEEPVVAAGGVRNLDDLRQLVALEVKGRRLAGVVVGREVTHGRFTLEEAKAVLTGDGGPRPARMREQRVVLHVSDLDRSMAFYRQVLGFRPLKEWPADQTSGGGAILQTGDAATLELFGPPKGDGEWRVSQGVRLAFAVSDLGWWLRRLEEARVPMLRPLTREPWGDTTVWVADPDGIAVTLFQRN